jgi:hypothetical protein
MELALPHEFNATSLTISTCTVLCNLNKRLSLELITRFAPVHELQAPELNEKSGGLYNIEFYGNCARGETMTDKINEMFNNQTTIKFKYWGFRMVNIKIFRNGRLQMTGLKHEEEAPLLASLLIDIISHYYYIITQHIASYNIKLYYTIPNSIIFYHFKTYYIILKENIQKENIQNNQNNNKQCLWGWYVKLLTVHTS